MSDPDRFARYPSLADRTVVVTGGASGIGAEIVTAFAAQGARVGLVDLDAEAGQALADRLGDRVAFARADLRDIDALRWPIWPRGRARPRCW